MSMVARYRVLRASPSLVVARGLLILQCLAGQIERILNPILLCYRRLPEVYDSCPRIASYIDEAFGGVDNLRKTMIADFFRHAFDGSGADNFYDAGSCIDGRLTSCWNWCSTVEKKKYFPAMLLTGFVGFDGKFDN